MRMFDRAHYSRIVGARGGGGHSEGAIAQAPRPGPAKRIFNTLSMFKSTHLLYGCIDLSLNKYGLFF